MPILNANEAIAQGIPNSCISLISANSTSTWGMPINSSYQSFANLFEGRGIPNLVISLSFSNEVQGFGSFSNVIALTSFTFISSQGYFHNYLSSFARFFGENSRQTATHIIIDKASLPRLVAHASNTAESLLVALLLQQMEFESNSEISKIFTSIFGTYILNGILLTVLAIDMRIPLKYDSMERSTNFNVALKPTEF